MKNISACSIPFASGSFSSRSRLSAGSYVWKELVRCGIIDSDSNLFRLAAEPEK